MCVCIVYLNMAYCTSEKTLVPELLVLEPIVQEPMEEFQGEISSNVQSIADDNAAAAFSYYDYSFEAYLNAARELAHRRMVNQMDDEWDRANFPHLY